MMTSKQIK